MNVAMTTDKIETKNADGAREEILLPERDPSRSALKVQYDAPSASSDNDSDAMATGVFSRRRVRGGKTPWYRKLRKRRNRMMPEPRHVESLPSINLDNANDPSAGQRWFWMFIDTLFRRGTVRNDIDVDDTTSYLSYNSGLTPTAAGQDYWRTKIRAFNYDIEASSVRRSRDTSFSSLEVDPNEIPQLPARHPFRISPGSLPLRIRIQQAFQNYYLEQTPDQVKLILIQNDTVAISKLIRDLSSDSPWFRRYGHELLRRVSDSGDSGDHYRSSSAKSTKKAQFLRILEDEENDMIQSAFCINHWVGPLDGLNDYEPAGSGSDSEGSNISSIYSIDLDNSNSLAQLVVYWQFRWLDTRKTRQNGGKPDSAAAVTSGNPTQIPTDAIDPTDPLNSIDNTMEPKAIHTSKKRKARRGVKDRPPVDESGQDLSKSNLIVVFERSQTGQYRQTTSVVLDALASQMANAKFVSPINGKNDFGLFQGNPKNSHVSEMLKQVVEVVLDTMTNDFDDKIDSYVRSRAKLSDSVYQNPADDILSSKLWKYSREFQNAGKMINILGLLVDDIRSAFNRHFGQQLFGESFLADLPYRFRNLAIDIEEELQKPTAEMIDLVYKSVSIRDARLSLELDSSLWRLSWVTFIFLPLTFLVGFFGMNVDTFSDDPSIKWYFIAAGPLLIFVLLSWLLFRFYLSKGSPRRRKRTPPIVKGTKKLFRTANFRIYFRWFTLKRRFYRWIGRPDPYTGSDESTV